MDAHAKEYAAAVEGMKDHTPHQGRTRLRDGRLVTTWAVGDWVTFRTEDHGPLQGTILEVLVEDGEYSQYHLAAHVPGCGREHFAVHNRDILIF
jgi:hypothetical protein